MPNIDIVVTTICEPTWLAGYLDNLRAHDRARDVTLRIICDRKTPSSVFVAAEKATRDGFSIDCPTLDEQQTYLQRLGVPDDFIPWNSDNRRNIGFLRAWESGAEILISIDDDNYCRPDSDFVGSHAIVGRRCSELAGDMLADAGPWFNACSLLNVSADAVVYPRGFPYAARSSGTGAATSPISAAAEPMTVAINSGLWLDDPDVDAITRIALRPRADSAAPGSVVLGRGTWAPINTQNTAVMRSAVPAYYYVRMGFPLEGTRIDRFGDILSGYFVQACAKHLGHTVRFGSPVTDHHRSPHDLFQDLYHELAGIVLTEELVPWLREQQLSGTTYNEAYVALADALAGDAHRFKGFVWDQGGRAFLVETAACMHRWHDTLRMMGAD